MEPGRLDVRLGTSLFYGTVSHLSECPDIGPECFGPDPPEPYNHHVDLFMADINLDLAYGVAPWFAVDVRLPLAIAHQDASFSTLDGVTFDDATNIHHRDETLVGPRDAWLVGRFASSFSGLLTQARLGVTIPIGRTEDNPFTAAYRGEAHQHLQFGTGTLVPVVGLDLGYALDPVDISLQGLGLFSLYENDAGYRAPLRAYANARIAVRLLGGELRPYAELTLAHEGLEIWDGGVGEEGTTARTQLLAGGGLAWQFLEDWSVDAGLRVQVARLTDAASFDSPGMLSAGLSASFDLAAEPSE